jgi:colanic acid biosynthesis glycosyl transferase WcaI
LKILILTQYFPPEVGAAQTRLYETARTLLNNGIDVEVFTSMPSYPLGEIFDNYKGCFHKQNNIDGINVYRVWSYASNDVGIIKRLFSYISFTALAFTSLTKVRPKPDLIFVESPPLTLGVTGYLLGKLWGCPWVLNISDLWPDSIFALGAISKGSLAGKSLLKLESFLYKRAAGITAVTEGMVSDLLHKKNIPQNKLYYLPNGANVDAFQPVVDLAERKQKRFIYAGRIGRAHGVEVIAKAAKLTEHRQDIIYQILGDGPELESLKKLASSLKINNIEFMEPVPLTEMPEKLKEAYAALVTLKDLPLFQGTRPAKMMAPLAAGLPIIYSGAGEGANLIKETGAGLITPPEDENALADAVIQLADHPQAACEMGLQGRKFAENNLDWNVLVKNWLHDIQERILKKG